MDFGRMCGNFTWCLPYIGLVTQIVTLLGSLTMVATLLVQIFRVKPDTTNVIAKYWLMVSRWLPTVGVDPHTKNLEAALEDVQGPPPK